MHESPATKVKEMIYLFDRVFLGKRISKFINNYLMQRTLRRDYGRAEGTFAIKIFCKSSALTDLADQYKTDKGGLRLLQRDPTQLTVTPITTNTSFPIAENL
jgi:hypothetical protein